MAPSNSLGKRVKGRQVMRPFIYGTTARPFDPDKNPKPPGVPDDHTHSWTVFVKGVDDTDITYWLKRVQFKLHESIPNHVRMVDGQYGRPFLVNETGWGEFEITIKFYYPPESGEKAQTVYHHLRLHAYGDDAQKSAMVENGEVVAWVYDEQLFNEPFETFYDILTSGATPGAPPHNYHQQHHHHHHQYHRGAKAGFKARGPKDAVVQPRRSEGGVLERSAMIPMTTRPGQPFSAEAESLEVKQMQKSQAKVTALYDALVAEIKEKEQKLRRLKEAAKAEQ